jgi:hypothetical protein
MKMKDDEIALRMRRAIIRRFGEACMPYKFDAFGRGGLQPWFRLTDTESGHFIEACVNCGGKRLHVFTEHDAEAR